MNQIDVERLMLTSHEDGWHRGYEAAVNDVERNISNTANHPRTRFADLPGLHTALVVIKQLKETWA